MLHIRQEYTFERPPIYYLPLVLLVAVAAFAAAVQQTSGELLHLMDVTLGLVALGAEVEVLALLAVVSRLHALGTRVASVDKLVLVLRMQFIQQGLSGKFAPPQAGEF